MENPTSRRNAIHQMSLIAAGMCFLPLVSCNNPENAEKSNVGETPIKPLLPFLIPSQAPLELGPSGSNMRTIIRSSQTNMQFSCIEAAIAPKKIAGSPHTHDALDELMYVLEGTASVLVGEDVVEVSAGSWHLRPRGMVHVVWNNSTDELLRIIDMYFNQNFEDYLEELYFKIFPEIIQGKASFDDPEVAKRIDDLNKEFGLTYFPEQLQPLVDKYGLS